jgi:hypothetical protein
MTDDGYRDKFSPGFSAHDCEHPITTTPILALSLGQDHGQALQVYPGLYLQVGSHPAEDGLSHIHQWLQEDCLPAHPQRWPNCITMPSPIWTSKELGSGPGPMPPAHMVGM